MGQSRIGWALGVIAPWCLGMGLVISFTANAGQDVSVGASLAFAAENALPKPFDLMPASGGSLLALAAEATGSPAGKAQLARLYTGELSKPGADEEGVKPRIALKTNAHGWPTPDRSHKGDPTVGLRPTFDAKFRQPGGLAAIRATDIMLNAENYLAFDGFTPFGESTNGVDAAFEPAIAAADDTKPEAIGPTASPAQSGSTPTLRAAIRKSPGIYDGATPAIPRAVALGSTTPADASQTPVEVIASAEAPHSHGAANVLASLSAARPGANATIVERDGERPNYSALIDQDSGSEARCLAEAVYFEARSEPPEGQAAVAQVVLNRVKSGLYPPTICGVVYQNRQHRNACQFSFACEGKSLRVSEPESWQAAVGIAHKVLDGDTWLAEVGGATHYHANYVRPRWSRALKKMDVIGHHIFYALREGQT